MRQHDGNTTCPWHDMQQHNCSNTTHCSNDNTVAQHDRWQCDCSDRTHGSNNDAMGSIPWHNRQQCNRQHNRQQCTAVQHNRHVTMSTDVRSATINVCDIGGSGQSTMVGSLEQRWQGRAMGKSQKAGVLLREDSLTGAWTQNTKHEKKIDIPLRLNPREQGKGTDDKLII